VEKVKRNPKSGKKPPVVEMMPSLKKKFEKNSV
jgi:hypothetical protein